jgi:putative transposase
MDGSICLTNKERKALLTAYRAGSDVRVARRAHVLLLRAADWTWEQIRSVLFCSNDLICETMRWFAAGGVEAILGQRVTERPMPRWLIKVLEWINNFTPQDFGYFRSRWSCEILSNLLAWEEGIRLSAETIRRGLHRLGFAWRRPRPVVGLIDPEYARKLRTIRSLLDSLPSHEIAVFQDEVDVHLNPKIGSMWMRKGEQALVETPGNNRKCHVAGSLVWQTGTLLVSGPQPHRNAAMFIAHLDDLRCRLRAWKKIHVICDNAKFHNCRAVQTYLASWGHRIVLHFLPKYAPETNPIERVWWHLHETITRNHRCRTLEELITQAYDWFETCNNHYLDMRHTFAKAA